jgi:Zn-dependent protease/CBS domain-containing protein
MKESVRLGRIAGVAVGFNWSLLVVAAFLAVGLASSRFPAEAPGYGKLAYAIAGAVTAVAFLAGVLAHEMSHAIVARREGLKVDGIVLWLMGGYTRISEDPPTPGAEFRISGIGPLVSLLLGLVSAGIAVLADRAGLSRLTVAVLAWLGTINILLAVFNILPGSPLDGGRVLHAAVWRWTKDRWRAASAASKAGRFLGALLIAAGLAQLPMGFGGFGGLWFAVIGWFLMAASRAEESTARLLHALEGFRASDVMTAPATAPGWLTAHAFLEQYQWGPPAYLLEQWGGGLAGVVPVRTLNEVPLTNQSSVRAVDFAIPFSELPVFPPEEPATNVMRKMAERDARWGLVVALDRIAGLLSFEGIPLMAEHARPPTTEVG